MLGVIQLQDDASEQLLQPTERSLPLVAPSSGSGSGSSSAAAAHGHGEEEKGEDEEERLCEIPLSQPLTEAAATQTSGLDLRLNSLPEELREGSHLESASSSASFSIDASTASEGGEEDEAARNSGPVRGLMNWSRQAVLKAVLLGLLLGSAFTIVYIYLYSWIVLLVHGRDPCDVPLAPWLLLYLLIVPLYLLSTCWQPWVNRVLCRWVAESADHPPPLRVKMLTWLFTFGGYYVLFFQMGLVKQAHSCRETAPALYNWAAYLAPTGLVHLFVLSLLISCSFTALVMITRASLDAPRPADPSVIRQLQTVVMEMTAGDERTCSICLDSYSEGQRAKVTPCCRNIFHKACLKKWLKHRRTCPLCREDLQEAVNAAGAVTGTAVAGSEVV